MNSDSHSSIINGRSICVYDNVFYSVGHIYDGDNSESDNNFDHKAIYCNSSNNVDNNVIHYKGVFMTLM